MAPHLPVQPLTQKGIGLAMSGESLRLHTAEGGFFISSPFPKKTSFRTLLKRKSRYGPVTALSCN
jgi:hypothetical protein